MTRTEEPVPVARRIDPAELKSVLGHFCTGVTVITAHDGESPHGFTCQSFVSLSLDPPYVSFSPTRTSTSWPRLRASEHVCVNVLAHDQRDVCGTFATSGADKFADVGWSHARNGARRWTVCWPRCRPPSNSSTTPATTPSSSRASPVWTCSGMRRRSWCTAAGSASSPRPPSRAVSRSAGRAVGNSN